MLDGFLSRVYSHEKASFLGKHGDWWHRDPRNRWVIEEGHEVVAYCAVIPTALRVDGRRVDAAWWVDLVVDSPHRGRGLQRAFDARIQNEAPLVVGFPNSLAARIHRKHGWGVRHDIEVRLLPLRPSKIIQGRATGRLPAAALKVAATAAAPLARRLRQRLETFQPRFSRVIEKPDPDSMAEAFLNAGDSSVITTYRDPDYLAWRYLEAPDSDSHLVVSGGDGDSGKTVAVIRIVRREGSTVGRILDLFGALDNEEVLRDVVGLAAKLALARGAEQVTAMSSRPSISRTLRKAGFLVRAPARFCWTSADETVSRFFQGSTNHFVLGDSDNDEP